MKVNTWTHIARYLENMAVRADSTASELSSQGPGHYQAAGFETKLAERYRSEARACWAFADALEKERGDAR